MTNYLKVLKPYPRFMLLVVLWGIQMAVLVHVLKLNKGNLCLVMGTEATFLFFLSSYLYCFGKAKL